MTAGPHPIGTEIVRLTMLLVAAALSITVVLPYLLALAAAAPR